MSMSDESDISTDLSSGPESSAGEASSQGSFRDTASAESSNSSIAPEPPVWDRFKTLPEFQGQDGSQIGRHSLEVSTTDNAMTTHGNTTMNDIPFDVHPNSYSVPSLHRPPTHRSGRLFVCMFGEYKGMPLDSPEIPIHCLVWAVQMARLTPSWTQVCRKEIERRGYPLKRNGSLRHPLPNRDTAYALGKRR